jgi:hypothetical protein
MNPDTALGVQPDRAKIVNNADRQARNTLPSLNRMPFEGLGFCPPANQAGTSRSGKSANPTRLVLFYSFVNRNTSLFGRFRNERSKTKVRGPTQSPSGMIRICPAAGQPDSSADKSIPVIWIQREPRQKDRSRINTRAALFGAARVISNQRETCYGRTTLSTT